MFSFALLVQFFYNKIQKKTLGTNAKTDCVVWAPRKALSVKLLLRSALWDRCCYRLHLQIRRKKNWQFTYFSFIRYYIGYLHQHCLSYHLFSPLCRTISLIESRSRSTSSSSLAQTSTYFWNSSIEDGSLMNAKNEFQIQMKIITS